MLWVCNVKTCRVLWILQPGSCIITNISDQLVIDLWGKEMRTNEATEMPACQASLPTTYLSAAWVSLTHKHTHFYHPDWSAWAHVIIMGIPALELRVLSVLQNILLALEVWVVEADEGPTLHTDGVDPVHEATVLEVVAVAADLQLRPRETFALIEHDLFLTTDRNCENAAKNLSCLSDRETFD